MHLFVSIPPCGLPPQLSDTETKAELLRQEVVELIQAKCRCSYSATFLSSPVLQCPPLDPDTSGDWWPNPKLCQRYRQRCV